MIVQGGTRQVHAFFRSQPGAAAGDHCAAELTVAAQGNVQPCTPGGEPSASWFESATRITRPQVRRPPALQAEVAEQGAELRAERVQLAQEAASAAEAGHTALQELQAAPNHSLAAARPRRL